MPLTPAWKKDPPPPPILCVAIQNNSTNVRLIKGLVVNQSKHNPSYALYLPDIPPRPSPSSHS